MGPRVLGNDFKVVMQKSVRSPACAHYNVVMKAAQMSQQTSS